MHHLDAISGEVVGVERQYPPNAMDIHRGDKPCVMNLAAHNAVLHDQALPLDIDSGSVRKPDYDPLDFLDLGQCQGRSESEAVICHGPGHNVLELEDVLQREIYRFACAQHLRDALDCNRVMLMIRLSAAQQNVRIDEHTHLASRERCRYSRG